MMKPPPPAPPPKPGSLGTNENIDTSSFSVSAAKALFETAKRPEFQKAAVAAAKNPFVRQTAKNVAQDEKARSAVLNAVKDPSGGNKVSAAFAVADANRKADGPPPPPHRASETPAPGKLSSAHSAIRSQLENLHLGGSSTTSSYTPSSVSPTPQSSTYASSSSYSSTSYQSSSAPPPPPPVPRHHASTAITTPHGIAKFEYAPAQADEMALRVGDVVMFHKNVDSMWIYGENQNTRTYGIVPTSYLDIKIPLKEAFVSPPPPPPPTSSSGKGLYATALYDYNSAEHGDLSFSTGDRIAIISRLNAEWLEGELRGRKGMFPAQYVDCPNLPSVAPQNTPSKFNVPSKTAVVAYDYDSGVATDLRVYEGDVITVIDDSDPDWLYGECRGREGTVPKSFLGPPYGSPKKQPIGIAEIANAFSPKKAVATGDFHTNDEKNLYVTKGDRLLIIEDVDEYYFRGRQELFKTLPPGNVPKNIVQFSN